MEKFSPQYKLADFVLDKKIGNGSFGIVWKARDIVNNTDVAIKQIDIASDKENTVLEQTLREIEILNLISNNECKNTMPQYYGYFIDDGFLYIIMELIVGIDLFDYMFKKFNKKDKNSVIIMLNILLNIATHLRCLHSLDIIHRDLKLENIMITNNNEPKIIDFGLSCTIAGSTMCPFTENHMAGSLLYVSPEELSGIILDTIDAYKKADIYSLGCVFYSALSGRMYIEDDQDQYQIIHNIKKGKHSNFKYVYPDSMKSIIYNMTLVDAKKRPTLDEVIAHINKVLADF